MPIRSLCASLGLLTVLTAIPVQAEAPSPFPEFEARRIKPPGSGASKRITVQIDPTETPATLVRPPPPPDEAATEDDTAGNASAAPLGRYGWFWDKVSPALSASRPGRLEEVITALSSDGQVAAPRLQDMHDIAQAQGIPILRSTVGTEVSPALVLAVIAVESAGKSDAVSSAGASGLMQLMPDTAARFGVTDRLEPGQSIAGGVRYLDWLMKEFGHDPVMVLAGYNAGEGAVRDHQGVPPYAETRDYVPKVLAAFQVARGLCTTPPELISDGCVFTSMN